jgi:hypothetical protein
MSRAKKSSAARTRKSSSPADQDLRWRIALHATIAIIFLSAFVSVFRICQIYVDRRIAFPNRPPKVVLVDRPDWMTDFLASEIIKTTQPIGLHSSFNRQLLIDTAKSLQSNPWIRQVNEVRRAYGQTPGDTLEIDCEYRVPAALVKWGDFYWLVDSQGVKLPEQYDRDLLPKVLVGADGKTNLRIIDGVSHGPPEAGQVWPGQDLAGGLEMARLLSDQNWADQIRDIDVSNFAGRRDEREAQLVLYTRFGTQIRWGRPPSAKDAFIEVPAPQKLSAIEDIYLRAKRVDDNQPWIDLRFDRVTCPRTPQTATAQLDAPAANAP